MSNIRIYQAYYKDEQKEKLDPEFTPFNNTDNPVNNLYEHYIYHQVRKLAHADNLDWWGIVSWQWRSKLQDIEPEVMLKVIQQSAEANCDVAIFNAYPTDQVYAYSVWEQGMWSHPYIGYLGQKILIEMGEHPELVCMPNDISTYLAANYFAGNRKFWDDLLEFLDRFVAALDKLTPEDTALLRSSAGYEPNPSLDYSGFLCERMISTYLVKRRMENNIKISAWVPNDDHEIGNMKEEAIATHNKELIQKWDRERFPDGDAPKFATEWIERNF